jgi:hypothetical protein
MISAKAEIHLASHLASLLANPCSVTEAELPKPQRISTWNNQIPTFSRLGVFEEKAKIIKTRNKSPSSAARPHLFLEFLHRLKSQPASPGTMSDPFSVSAGVVGVVSLGLTLAQGFLRYYGPWKDFDDDIRGFTTKVEGLLQILRLLDRFLSPENELSLPTDQYRQLVLTNLVTCEELCCRLEKKINGM